MKQMGNTFTVGRSKPFGRHGTIIHGKKTIRKNMFKRLLIIAKPDLTNFRFSTKIIHMPVRFTGYSKVMHDSRDNTSRPECTSCISIKSGLETKSPDFSHPDIFFNFQPGNNGISALGLFYLSAQFHFFQS